MDTGYRLILLTLLLWHDDVTEAVDTLYAQDDPIVQLDVSNFDQTLTMTPHGWVVEFYATWCGHCQRFAPIYKEYAEDIAGWSKVIRVAAIACSDPKNLPVCRKQNIRGFPTVKFYPPNMRSVARGFKLTSLRFHAGSVRDATLQFIDDYVARSQGSYPTITSYDSVQQLEDAARTEGTSYLFAIVEDGLTAGSNLAKSVILDMSSQYPRVMIGRLPKSAILDQESLWQPLPSVVSISLRDSRVRFVTQLNTRDDVKRVIQTLSSGSWNLDPTTPLPSVPVRPPTQPLAYVNPIRQTGQELPLVIPLQTTTPVVLDTNNKDHVHEGDGDGVAHGGGYVEGPEPVAQPEQEYSYSPARSLELNDLDSNIYYMLWNEVASRRRIRGSALPALKNYLSVLSKYHPSDERLHSFLETVYTWMKRIGGSVDSTLYLNTVEGLQTPESYVTKELDWVACEGSQGKFRGYPCSLWMTFHALTVAAYERYLQNPLEAFDPMEVLGAIRAYVRYFLGCRECAEHFQKMAEHMEREVSQPVDVILWLWWAHNRVNNRLHGDTTEDPAHPKIQFPGSIACPTCRLTGGPIDKFDNETIWNIPEVIKFLRGFYAKENILGLSPSTMMPPLLTSMLPSLVEGVDLSDSYHPDRRGDQSDTSRISPDTDHRVNADTHSGSAQINVQQPSIGRNGAPLNVQQPSSGRNGAPLSVQQPSSGRDGAPLSVQQPRPGRDGTPGNVPHPIPGRNGAPVNVPTPDPHRDSVPLNVPLPDTHQDNAPVNIPLPDRHRDNSHLYAPPVNLDRQPSRHTPRATAPPTVFTLPSQEERRHRDRGRDRNNPPLQSGPVVDSRNLNIPGSSHYHRSSHQSGLRHSGGSSSLDQIYRHPGETSGQLQRANDPVSRRSSIYLRTVVTEAPSVRQGNSPCVTRAGTWSPCTVTCDTGISTRLSNDNDECEMRLEMRVCQVRPCSFNIGNPRPHGSEEYCTANMRSATHTALTFNGCTTLKGYTWRFCNRCPGYCCKPTSESTFWTDVSCRHGNDVLTGSMPISWIVGCHCQRGNC